MKKLLNLLLIPLVLFTSPQSSATDDITFGVGLGSLYSGIGLNVGMQSANDLKYISAGCMSFSSFYGSTCGLGGGWVKTDIFDFQTNKHGLGFYLGIVGSERGDATYGGGLGYHYFFRGINQPGFTLGFTIVAANEDKGTGIGSLIQLGYQF